MFHTLTTLVNFGSVRVHVVGLDHAPGAEDFSTLVVSIGGLTADIHHGLDSIRVAHKTRGSIESLRSRENFNALINVARANGKDLDRVSVSKETGHVKIVDSHVSEDPSATLDILEWWWRWIAGAQLNLSIEGVSAQYSHNIIVAYAS